jgi:AcrR family transcriptional regulator
MNAPDDESAPQPTGGVFARFFRRQPVQRRSRALVDALVIALEQELARVGDPLQWTLEPLLERAGVGIGSFYEYFSNKESLVGALVGRVTQRNFVFLIDAAARVDARTLDALVGGLASAVAETYLRNPRAMRLIVHAIARLGLLGVTHSVRDRFTLQMIPRVRSFYPEQDDGELLVTIRMICDGAMGMVAAELDRDDAPDVGAWTKRFEQFSMALFRTRHGEPQTR